MYALRAHINKIIIFMAHISKILIFILPVTKIYTYKNARLKKTKKQKQKQKQKQSPAKIEFQVSKPNQTRINQAQPKHTLLRKYHL